MPVHATPADLPPHILTALTAVLEDLWDREADDYRQLPPTERHGHRYRDCTALHHWLGARSPIRPTTTPQEGAEPDGQHHTPCHPH
ncbi:hypothetical protein [Nocardia jejuensis]|uniref:hypothetical protein n=1 Tax=Nocardia jejuensis TaxID=328049 RepID=UPI00082C02D8|nr:hypothetical protein [Nocardia jejuensis]